MAAALLVNSVLSKFYVLSNNPSPNENALRAMVAMNFVFSFFFTMIGVISWVYPAEVCLSNYSHPFRCTICRFSHSSILDISSGDPRTGEFSLNRY